MTTIKDFHAITDQLRAAVHPDVKVSVQTTIFNPFDGTPARSHYKVTADIGDDVTGFTRTDWFPVESPAGDVVEAALRMIKRLRPAPAAGDEIQYGDKRILVQYLDVTPQGNWRISGRYLNDGDFECLADVQVRPFDWDN